MAYLKVNINSYGVVTVDGVGVAGVAPQGVVQGVHGNSPSGPLNLNVSVKKGFVTHLYFSSFSFFISSIFLSISNLSAILSSLVMNGQYQ